MKRIFISFLFLLLLFSSYSQKIVINKIDITPKEVSKIGGISFYHNQLYLLLQANVLFQNKEIEASESKQITQKYPVWDVYQYNPDSGLLKNVGNQWKTSNAIDNGFCIVDSQTVVFVNNKNKLVSNNKKLNSVLSEISKGKNIFIDPFVNKAGDRIYFSSDLDGGIGKMDIWYIEKKEEKWNTPINAGNKINSAYNDCSPSTLNDTLLVFTSNRYEKNYDLFYFDLKMGQIIHHEETINENELMVIAPLNGIIYYTSESNKTDRLRKGEYSTRVSGNFKNIKSELVEEIKDDIIPESSLNLVKIDSSRIKEENYKLTNYFGLAKYDLTPVMKDSLNRLAFKLKNNSDLSILICGHASPDGSDFINMMLSYYRANEAYKWLVEQQIDSSRIYRIYGGEYLFNDTIKARNFSIFTFVPEDIPSQMVVYKLSANEKASTMNSRFQIDSDDFEYIRYQINRHLPLHSAYLLLLPVSDLFFTKEPKPLSEIVQQFKISKEQLMKVNNLNDDLIKEDRVIYIP